MSPRWTRKAGPPGKDASRERGRLAAAVAAVADGGEGEGLVTRRRGTEADRPRGCPEAADVARGRGEPLQAHHLEAAAARRRGPARRRAPRGATARPLPVRARPHDRRRRAAHARHVRPARREPPAPAPEPDRRGERCEAAPPPRPPPAPPAPSRPSWRR